MQGTNSKDANIIYIGLQEYFGNIPLGEFSEIQASVFEKIMVDGGIVCDDAYDTLILQIQDQFINSSDESKDDIISNFINFLYDKVT